MKIWEKFKGFFKKEKTESANSLDDEAERIKIIEDKNRYRYITSDDAYFIFYKIYTLMESKENISGILLNIIYDGLCDENTLIQIDKNIDTEVYKEYTIKNKQIQICRVIISRINKEPNYFILAIENDEKFSYQGEFISCKTNSNFSYFKPSNELLNSNIDSLVISGPKQLYYDSIVKFYKNLCKYFSVYENNYFRVLVLKLLFSQYGPSHSITYKTLMESHEFLSKAIENMKKDNVKTLQNRISDINFSSNNYTICFDANIVFNAFVDIFNSLDENDRENIEQLYNICYSNYFSKVYS